MEKDLNFSIANETNSGGSTASGMQGAVSQGWAESQTAEKSDFGTSGVTAEKKGMNQNESEDRQPAGMSKGSEVAGPKDDKKAGTAGGPAQRSKKDMHIPDGVYASIRRRAEREAKEKYGAEAAAGQGHGTETPISVQSAWARAVKSREAKQIEKARKSMANAAMDRQLAKIREVYPDIKAKNVFELGDTYMAIMASGAVDPVTAFEASSISGQRRYGAKPKSIGSVKSQGGENEKTFYSPTDVDRLSKTDLTNPKIWKRVRKSMTKW